MRKILFAAVLAFGCKANHTAAPARSSEVTAEYEERRPLVVNEDNPDDGNEGTGTAAALDEGKMGKLDSDRAEGQYKLKQQEDAQLARQQAIEQARNAGILGTTALVQGGSFASLTGTGDYHGGDRFKDYGKNPWIESAKDNLSTFAADVDTASYSLARRSLTEGSLPNAASVRVEEFVNYFKYAFAAPTAGTPFSVIMDAAPSPLSPGRHLVRLGVATKPKLVAERKPAHLVFLVDVSGSMSSDDKLPLAKQALHILTASLTAKDSVSLVTYAGSTDVILEPTAATFAGRARINAAIEELSSGGSTAMASGIDLAYARAVKQVHAGEISRVIVLSDGDANVGPHTHDEMLQLIEGRAKEGVTLSTIGFGVGNYNDQLMEQLADKGNGNNFYVDSLDQAKKIFVEDLTANLEVVAKDVKLQVEFNPAFVARYRLVGYENRDIKDEDFRNDKVDAGEVGAGHQVTALYEVELTALGKQLGVPLGAVRTRHKAPDGTKAVEAAFPMIGGPAKSFANASADFRFAVAAAAFADVLRGGQDAEHWSLATIRDIAKNAAGDHPDRRELVSLIETVMRLKSRTASR